MYFRKGIPIMHNLQYLLLLDMVLVTARAVKGTLRLYQMGQLSNFVDLGLHRVGLGGNKNYSGGKTRLLH